MLPVEYSFLYKIITCTLLGIVIEVLDDYIDGDIENTMILDLSLHSGNKAILPYCLILFAIATGFNVEYGVTLMSSCYIVGMFYDLNLKLPSKIKSYHESIIIFLVNVFLFSLLSFLTSLLIIFLIQLFDDIRDMKWDKKYGFKNYANRFGKVEVILVALIIGIIIGLFDMEKLLIVFSSFILVDYFFYKKTVKL